MLNSLCKLNHHWLKKEKILENENKTFNTIVMPKDSS